MKVKGDLYEVLKNAGILTMIKDIFIRYGDEVQEYTEEEEKVMEELVTLMEAEYPEFQKWKSLAPKNVLVMAVRIFKMDNKFTMHCMKKLLTLFLDTYPDLLAQMDVSYVKKLLGTGMVQVVKRKEDDEGPGIFVFRLKKYDPAEATLEEVALASGLIFLAISRSFPTIQKKGFICITDSEGFRFAHARLATFDLVIKGLRVHGAVPHSMCKGTHIFNSSSLLDKTYSIFKWMLPKTVTGKFNFTKTDHSFLQKFVTKDKLPMEFWGTIPDSEAYFDDVEEEIKNDDALFEFIEKFQTAFLKFKNIQKTRV